jgi:hypothetical protein
LAVDDHRDAKGTDFRAPDRASAAERTISPTCATSIDVAAARDGSDDQRGAMTPQRRNHV